MNEQFKFYCGVCEKERNHYAMTDGMPGYQGPCQARCGICDTFRWGRIENSPERSFVPDEA
ncbi:MAG TPA: hypothetical protein EYN18_01725 [Nitrospirales bacterium]|jgi:hypothetical protein|nr:hypothetical protein [Nitrospirales bacterium]